MAGRVSARVAIAALVFAGGVAGMAVRTHAQRAPAELAPVTQAGTMPQAASSFGAALADGWIYVYGGHIVPTHSYSVDAVSGKFARRKVADGSAWESLPPGPAVQGMNIVAHGGRVYRVGGMEPRNRAGQPADNWSLDTVARFDPERGAWEALPPLPAPRSSHDVVVSGNRLVVVGGWNMRGVGQDSLWPDTMEVLDLSAPTLAWKSVPQPFRRRALVAAADTQRIYVVGGFDDANAIDKGLAIYDVATATWSEGPILPGGQRSGFGPAAVVVDGRLYVSIDDGGLYRLDRAGKAWEHVAKATPRIVHRLVSDGSRIYILGGASRGGNSDLIEAVAVKP